MITFELPKRKILIIDDDAEFRKMISLMLKDRGFSLMAEGSGRAGIERARSEVPELVLLDLNLPDTNGREILRRIREISEEIATIVITGFGGERVAIDLMKAGAMDFISKPFEMEMLLKSIDDVLTLRDARIEDRRYGGLSSLGKFFPFLAHEIRNPLHAIAGSLAIIQRRTDSKDEILSRSIGIINEEVEHLTHFVQECLNFVRHPVPGYFVDGQINEMISIVMSLIFHMFEDLSKKIRVTYRLDPNLPKIPVNYEEMKQVFLNLVKNSFESMPNGGEFVIETSIKASSSGEFLAIVFSDQGSGIREEEVTRIFDPFFTTKLRGSGLGLAICRRIIVERHKGKIEIDSKEGKGTTVALELPIHPRPDSPGSKLP